MIAASRSVTFTDLLILNSIQEAEYQGFLPSKYRIIQIFNEFISFHEVQIDRTTKITNSYSFQQHIDKLRKFYLITPHKEYRLTGDAVELLKKIGDTWRQWPMYLPFDGTFKWSEAFYLN